MAAGADARETVLVHATGLALGDRGVIVRGPSGAGKSDLALQALAVAPGVLSAEPFRLVSDDRVVVTSSNAGLMIAAPPAIAGKLEVRGLGIIDLPAAAIAAGPVRLTVVVDLVASLADIERLPERGETEILGCRIPCVQLYPFEASAAMKLVLLIIAA